MSKNLDKIPSVLKAIEGFAIFCKDRWRAVLVTMFIVLMLGSVLLLLYYGYKRIDTLGIGVNTTVDILEKTHSSVDELQNDFKESVKDNINIEEEMIRCVFAHKADAMIIFKFHNTRTDLQGKHDFFYSSTNEVRREKSIKQLTDTQNIPMVRLGQFITPMLEGRIQTVVVSEITGNVWLRNKLEAEGIVELIVAPIYNRNNLLIGFAELVYNVGTIAPEEEKREATIKCFVKTVDHIGIIMQK